LSHPGKSYRLLEPDECIGGYPDLSKEVAANLDSEGRALVLDFGAFVLIGVYCPAATDPSRDHFRACFVEALCTRVRKLVSDLKREVVVVGDLNIAREEIDACDAQETMKEAGMTHWKEALTRASLDRLLLPHPSGIMVDLCRERFPDRTGMFTCMFRSPDPRIPFAVGANANLSTPQAGMSRRIRGPETQVSIDVRSPVQVVHSTGLQARESTTSCAPPTCGTGLAMLTSRKD